MTKLSDLFDDNSRDIDALLSSTFMLFTAGSRIGPYEVVAPLGAGGMGEVHRATDTRLGRAVALKVLTASNAGSSAHARFRREAKAIARLNHPHICTLHDVVEQDGQSFMVMELVEGVTLAQELAHGPLSLDRTVAFGAQVADALDAAHSHGVIHLDLKPSNIMLTDHGVKLLDFGVARLRDVDGADAARESTLTITPTEDGAIAGSYPYMSPEQVQGREADARSDIFSLGVVLYEMATGRHPFQADNRAALVAAILTHTPPATSTLSPVPPILDRLVARCLEKAPEARWQTARDLASALRWAGESEFSVSAATSDAATPLPRRLRSRRVRWGAALAGISALAVLGIGAMRALPNLPLTRSELPLFDRITFQRGLVSSARFGPDGETIVYSAAWQENPFELFLTRVGEGNTESRPLGVTNARILSMSRSGEMAFLVGRQRVVFGFGTLSRSPLSGTAPRPVLEGVREADWIGASAELAVVRNVDGRDTLEFPLGRKVHESTGLWSMRVSPDGTRAAMVDGLLGTMSGDVIVVDTSGRRTVLSRGWPVIYGLAWSPRGNEVWFSGGRDGFWAVHGVSLSGRERVMLRAPELVHLQDVSRAGTVLLTSLASTRDELWCLPPGDREERNLGWLDGPWVQDVSADGQQVLFSEERAGGGEKSAVYLRKMDGSPPVRLADGHAEGLSPDGQWALVYPIKQPPDPVWTIVPTGAGSARTLPSGGFTRLVSGDWLADNRHIAFTAQRPNEEQRIFVQDTQGGPPRAISPEGFRMNMAASTPDGRFVVASSPKGLFLVPVDGGEPRPLPQMPGTPIRWSPDGRHLFTRRDTVYSPVEIHRVEVATGRSTVWKALRPRDMVGVDRIFPVVVTPDGQSYCYTATRNLSDLYAVTGVR